MTLFDPGPAVPEGSEPGSGTDGAGRRTRRPAAPGVTQIEPATQTEPATQAEPAGTAGAAAAPGGAASVDELPAAPAHTVRIRLDVAYDGSGFRGFAAQPGQRTVAGVLLDAVATVARHRVELTCAGRTDAGVHARGQVVHLDVAPGTDLRRLVKSVNALLGPAVVVRRATVAPDGFDARHSARARRYRYLVHEGDVPDPLLAPLAWTVPGPLDLRALRAGADALLGEHDFRAFCRRAPGTSPHDPIPRLVLACGWTEIPASVSDLGPGERLLRFDIAANAFCHQMVRSIVGLLVEVGRRRRRAADVHWLLVSGDRSQAPDPAPSQGLCLVGVDY